MNAPLWFSNLLSWSLQAAVLVLAAAFLPRIFQIRQSHVLLVYWRVQLLLSLALPFVQHWHRPPSLTVPLAPDFAQAPLPPPTSVPADHWHLPDLQMVGTLVGVMMLAGIGVRFFLLAVGLLKLRHFRQASSAIFPSAKSTTILESARNLLETSAEFRLSAEVNSPVTFGFWRPVILLPERFLSLDERFQSAIACHELLHVRRHDWAHHLSEEVLRAVFWFHPAVAWLISRVRLAREQVVDSEVVQLTKSRKTYIQALLAFTPTRQRVAVVPAPPFLIESQLAERVSLMLKEVRVSPKKLIASCVVIACCLGLAIGLAAWAFPLQGAPLFAQSAPTSGVSGGVPGGITRGVSGNVSGGVAQGISGGVAGGINGDTRHGAQGNEPNVEISTIWTDTVKRGPMVRQVRGLGKLVRASDSANLIVRIALPEVMVKEVGSNQHASVDLQKGHLASARVISVNPKVTNGEVSVNLALEGALPEGIHSDQDVDVTIDIEQLNDILFVGRPVHVAANSGAPLFKIIKDGTEAERTSVKFGRTSVNTIEVLAGLKEGDKVILSDMSDWEKFGRIHLK